MSQQLTAEELTYATHIAYIARYCQLSAAAVVFYDYFLTLRQEVDLIWRKRWSKSKVLYLLCRYVGHAVFISESLVYLTWHPTYTLYVKSPACVWGIRIAGSEAILSTWITQLIMQFRIQALYNKKLLSQVIFALFLCEAIYMTAIGLLMMQKMHIFAEPYPGTFGCTRVEYPGYSFVLWIPVILFDSLMFGLAAKIAIKNWRSLPKANGNWYERLGPSLVVVLLRDNFSYFLFAFVTYLTNVIVWAAADARFFSVSACFAYSITIVMGCRLILNLCDAYYNPTAPGVRVGSSPWNTTTNWDEINAKPSIRFAPNPANVTMATMTTQNTLETGHKEDSETEMSTISGHTTNAETSTKKSASPQEPGPNSC